MRGPRRRAAVCAAASMLVVVPSRTAVGPVQPQAKASNAFAAVASVLASSRCANCHIDGDAPLQGEDGRVHAMNVRRGADGRGILTMRCTNCHQDESSTTPHAPPGGPDWRLPPAVTPMAWRGLSQRDVCRMLIDRNRNGNRSLADLLEHVAADPLVMSGWSPGFGRPVPPLSHEVFVQRFREWIAGGARCPD